MGSGGEAQVLDCLPAPGPKSESELISTRGRRDAKARPTRDLERTRSGAAIHHYHNHLDLDLIVSKATAGDVAALLAHHVGDQS